MKMRNLSLCLTNLNYLFVVKEEKYFNGWIKASQCGAISGIFDHFLRRTETGCAGQNFCKFLNAVLSIPVHTTQQSCGIFL